MDRRVRRTRRVLCEAFVALLLERGYDKVTVQDILDRADVGRSTFYAHYRDKEALLLATFDDMRDRLSTEIGLSLPHTRTYPVAALFEHAYRNRPVFQAMCGRQSGAVVRRLLHQVVGEVFRDHLRPRLAEAGSDLPVDVAAEFYTSAAVGLLVWWVDRDFPYGPERLARMYHDLAAPAVHAVLSHDHG